MRYTKDEMLKRFKPTTQLDMNVFKSDTILEYADLFASTGDKPQFGTSTKSTTDEEADPFDDLAGEAEKKGSSGSGLVPESIKPTQSKPTIPLQQTQRPYNNQGGAGGNRQGNFQKNNYQQNQGHSNHYRQSAAGNFAAYDDDDEDPSWNDFDPEKETGNFFGREIVDESKIREEIEL